MNDKDKEAFVKFMEENLPLSYYDSYHCREKEAWQAACEYKQKEIDDLNDLVFAIETNNKSMEEQIEYLQAENAKLIEQDQIISQEIKTYIDIANRLQAENAKLKKFISVLGHDDQVVDDVIKSLEKLERLEYE